MRKQNVVQVKAFGFAIRMVKAYQYLAWKKREFVISKQMLRSGTSIGANISEANGAISKADFSSKISIAYKECLETKYWISLLWKTGFIEEKVHESLYSDADEIGRILFSILKSTRFKSVTNDH
jgi:four helix bundle protein